MKRTVRSDFGEVSIRTKGVIHAKVLHGVEIDLKKAEIYHSLVEHLSKNEQHSTVIDLTGISGITPDARAFLQKTSSEWGKTVAVALVTNTFTARVLANFFLSINKPSYPVKVFSDALDAQHWARNEYLKVITRVAS
ncbi:MAG: hypothetical protein H6603_06655 [Flavobacteriales bacterium]|nr:hypothetical protein [Flavobacteriales bacterium]MCB9190394.1 hypothetical protein [Flavobacteriales bacterium]MCB9204643.1 hypothetical protein [Flavobacteriales bacterium]